MFFGWFRKKKYFEGSDITDFEYLGYSVISYHEKGNPSVTVNKAAVYCFVKKDDHTVRKCILRENDYYFHNHQWYNEFAAHWVLGSYDLEKIIHTMPSTFLTKYMLENKNKEWDTSTCKWIDIRTPVKIEKKEDNVVQLSFPDHKITLDKPLVFD